MSRSTGPTRHIDDSTTITPGGTPFRLLEGSPVIRASNDGTEATEDYLIKATDAAKFYRESFPPPIIVGSIGFLPPRRRMPGSSFLVTQTMEFSPFDTGKPWDPFGEYDGHDASMDDYCRVSITYKAGLDSEDRRRDSNDPITFLERRLNAGGQWLSIPPQKTLVKTGDVQNRRCAKKTKVIDDGGKKKVLVDGAQVTPESLIDNNGGGHHQLVDRGDGDVVCLDPQGHPSADLSACSEAAVGGEYGPEDELEENRDQEMPVLFPIQTIDYTFRWPLVVNPQIGRYLAFVGRVNSDINNLFFNAKRETILFMGLSAEQKFVWDGATARAQPWNLEFRFSQRLIHDCGRTYGWNHVYSPDKGQWVRVFRANGQPLHKSFSIRALFR